MAGAAPPPPVADPLFEVTPDEFVAARDALARSLKADGDKALAAVVAKLRRPSPSAWALNQVARSDGALVTAALAAGAELRAASEAAAAGDAGALRAATAADREATNRVVAAAVTVLGSKGPGLRQELAATMRAAVLDDAVAAELESGVLTAAHAAPGFGFGLDGGDDGLAPPWAPKPKAKAAPAQAPVTKGTGGDAKADKAAAAAALAETKAAVAAKEAAAVEEAERRGRRKEIAELRRTIKRLDATAARLSGRADEAEAVAAEARLLADATEAELAAAQDRLAELGG